MSSIWTVAFWKATAERAVRGFAWSLLSTLGAGATNVVEMPWQTATGIAAGAAVLSVLASVASSAITGGGPSLTNAERLPHRWR